MISLSLPSEASIDAAALVSLFPLYLASLAKTSTKPKTLTSYQNQIKPFFEWWELTGPPDYVLSKSALLDFAHWVRHDYRTRYGLPPKPYTVRTICIRVRQFLNWLHTSGCLPISIHDWLPLPPAPKVTPNILSAADLTAILGAARGMSRVRDLALVALLVETGIRRFEAANAAWQNVTWLTPEMADHHGILFRPWLGWLYLDVVKGYLDHDKTRTVVFGPKTGKLLQLLRVVHGVEDGAIFELSNSGVRHALNALARPAGVDFGAHDFRRTFATYWTKHYSSGTDNVNSMLAARLLDVQLGHAPRSMAERHYVALTHIDVAANYVSPLDGVSIAGL